jgi:nucleoside-diphosphate-sugar epimerase
MTPAKPRVLVTGGRGFIGRHLVSALAHAGYEVTSLDIAPPGGAKTGSVREVLLDTRDTAAVQALAQKSDFETVFDLASYTDVGQPKEAYRRNLDSTLSMIGIVKRCNIAKYIFVSTQFVFRRPGILPKGEDDFFPVDNYGASKAESETAIRAGLTRERFLILRPTYVWGPGLDRFKYGLLYRLAKGQLLVSRSPASVRYYGYVKTVAAQTIAISRLDFNQLTDRVYYLSDEAVTVRSFCKPLLDALGQGRTIAVPAPLIRILGLAGSGLATMGLSSPINTMQARELTTNFPVPIARTIELTGAVTDLPAAAAETVAWARSDPDWLARITR